MFQLLSESPGVPKLKCDDWLVRLQDVYSLLEIRIPSTYLLLSFPLSIYGSNCLKLLLRLTNCPWFNAHTSSVSTCLCTNFSTTLSSTSILWTVILFCQIWYCYLLHHFCNVHFLIALYEFSRSMQYLLSFLHDEYLSKRLLTKTSPS